MDKPKISFETRRLFVRSIEAADMDAYMNLRVKASPMARAYEEYPEFKEHIWNDELNSQDDIYMAIFLKGSNIFVASAFFQGFRTDTIEFGFDVREQYRNQGIATELVMGLLHEAKTTFPGTHVIIRTDKENGACRKVAEKCGGVLSGYEPTLAAKAFEQLMKSFGDEPTDDEKLIQMRRRNREFIEENREGVCVYRFE